MTSVAAPSEPATPDSMPAPWAAWSLAAVLLTLIAHRLYLLAIYDFPIGDGGLFVAFVEAQRRSFPSLPVTVDFNSDAIPYAYPPLSFWLGAVLSRLGVPVLDVVRVLPFVWNILFLGLVAVLARRNNHGYLTIGLVLIVLGSTFRSFEWLVMGGGLSRGLGSILLVLTLLSLSPLEGRRSAPMPLRWAALIGACVAGTLLSHLEWGLLAAVCVVLARALTSTGLRDFAVSLTIIAGVAAVLVLPWVAVVVSRHGADPFLAASASGGSSLQDLPRLGYYFVRANVANLLLFLGGIVLLMRRRWFWLLFVGICLAFTPRHSLTPIVLPVSIVTAEGAVAAFLYLRRRSQKVTAYVVPAVLFASVVVMNVSTSARPDYAWGPLPADVRAAMMWVRREQPAASFAVLTGRYWSADFSAEWFPYLTRAESVTTLQGREWLPAGAFARREAIMSRVNGAAGCEESLAELRALGRPDFLWVERGHSCFDHVGPGAVFATNDVRIVTVR